MYSSKDTQKNIELNHQYPNLLLHLTGNFCCLYSYISSTSSKLLRLEEQSGRERSSKDHRMQPHMSLPSSHKPHYKNAMPK